MRWRAGGFLKVFEELVQRATKAVLLDHATVNNDDLDQASLRAAMPVQALITAFADFTSRG
ncbi:MAG: hypothetical protein ACREXM_04720 [Gammaproteobacteria bacterium]